jgi:hypothetical protein
MINNFKKAKRKLHKTNAAIWFKKSCIISRHRYRNLYITASQQQMVFKNGHYVPEDGTHVPTYAAENYFNACNN